MKKGFTLMELLAVIVVVSITFLIATPITSNVLKEAEKSSFSATCNEIYRSYSQYEVTNDNKDVTCDIFDFETNRSSVDIIDTIRYIPIDKLNIKGDIPTSGMYKICDGYKRLIIDNGKYTCIKDNNGMKIIDGTIKDNDIENPVLNDIILSSTTSSIKVVADVIENDGMITNYYYKIDGVESLSKGNVKIYENLKKNTEYEISVTVESKSGLKSNTITKKIKTKNINTPTYSVTQTPVGSSYATSKKVTILYDISPGLEYYFKSSISVTIPSKMVVATCGTSTTPGSCTASNVTTLEANTWYKTTNTTPSIIYKANGTLYALAKDSTNASEMSTYTVSKIDTSAPTASMSVGSIKTDRVTVTATCSDAESGITKYEYSKDNGINWVDNGTSASYTFTGLTKETSYEYKVRCTNGSWLTKEASDKAATLGFINPTIKQISQVPASGYSYATSRTIQITYSNANVADPIYYFKSSVTGTVASGVVTAICGTSTTPESCTNSTVTTLVANTWYKTNTISPSVIYKINGILYALTSDGKNISGTSTYTISKIDTIDPTVTATVNEKIATFKFSDNIGITGYGVNTSSTTAPNFTSTTSTTASWTASSAGTYYVWVRDVAGRTGKTSFNVPQSAFSYAATAVNADYKATATPANYNATSVNGNYTATAVDESYAATEKTSKHCSQPGGLCKNNGWYCVSWGSKCSDGSAPDFSQGYGKADGFYCDCSKWEQGSTTYSCPDGGTLSGTTCKKTSYTCPNGGTLSGTTCLKTNYTCPNGGTLSETTCLKTNYSCPNGGTLSGTTCKKTNYTCPNGGTLSGTTCIK